MGSMDPSLNNSSLSSQGPLHPVIEIQTDAVDNPRSRVASAPGAMKSKAFPVVEKQYPSTYITVNNSSPSSQGPLQPVQDLHGFHGPQSPRHAGPRLERVYGLLGQPRSVYVFFFINKLTLLLLYRFFLLIN